MREAVKVTIRCAGCGAEKQVNPTSRGLERLPRGWRRLDSPYCGKCVAGRYRTLAVTLPVAKPMDSTWAEFRAQLSAVWRLTSQCATWMMRECYARDTARESGAEKMQPMPRVYLYPEARERYPDLPSQTVAALEQQVKAKYSASRLSVLWRQDAQLPTLTYPQPFIVPAQGWKVHISSSDRGEILLSLPLGGQRVQLRLRGGSQFRRQRRMIEQIVSGEAIQGELAIYRKRAQGTDRAGKNGQKSSAMGTDRGDGGQHIKYDVMAKLVAHFPREDRPGGTGVLSVKTAADSLLVALDAKGERLWRMNADHAPRWIAEHWDRLQRWSDDSKAEQRPIASFAARRSAAALKFRHRMDSLIKESASQLVRFAKRRHYATLRYDDSERGFASSFEWFALREAIARKCDAEGIEFVHASGEAALKTPQSLAT